MKKLVILKKLQILFLIMIAISVSFFTFGTTKVQAQAPGIFMGIAQGKENGAIKSKIIAALSQEVEYLVITSEIIPDLLAMKPSEICEHYDNLSQYSSKNKLSKNGSFAELLESYINGKYYIYAQGKFLILVHQKSSNKTLAQIKNFKLSLDEIKSVQKKKTSKKMKKDPFNLSGQDMSDLVAFLNKMQALHQPLYLTGHGQTDGIGESFEEYFRFQIMMINERSDLKSEKKEKKINKLRELYRTKSGTSIGLKDAVFESFINDLIQYKVKNKALSPIHIESCFPHHIEKKICTTSCPIMLLHPGAIATTTSACGKKFAQLFSQSIELGTRMTELASYIEKKDKKSLRDLLDVYKEDHSTPLQVYLQGMHTEITPRDFNSEISKRPDSLQSSESEGALPPSNSSSEDNFDEQVSTLQGLTTGQAQLNFLDTIESAEERYNLTFYLTHDQKKQLLSALKQRQQSSGKTQTDDSKIVKAYFDVELKEFDF